MVTLFIDERRKSMKKMKICAGIILLGIGLISCAPNIYSSDLSLTNSSGVTYDGPLVITKGGTYSGNWESQNPNVPAIRVQTSDPVIIENSNIRGRGDLISGFANRLTVRNVNGYGLNPNIVGQTVGKFVNAEEFINIRIENSYAENTIGVYFRSYKGNPSNGDTITILKNKFKNINGLPSSGNNGYSLDYFLGKAHMIMFNDVKRIPNAEIAWNEVINEPGKSLVEENINIYTSGGTPSSPIKIHDNYIQGGYSAQPTTKGDYAGGGIILGDGALYAPDVAGYTDVYNNQIVSTTNQGIAISGGVENHIHDNRIISSGLLQDGGRIMAQNVGIYMWNSGATSSNQRAKFSNNSMENNYVSWVKVNEAGIAIPYPWWLPDCGANNNTCANNVSNDNPTLDSEKREYTAWLEKLKAQNITIGVAK